MASCANEVAKEKKEKNTTTLAKYHGVLLVTTDDYLQKDILLSNELLQVDL